MFPHQNLHISFFYQDFKINRKTKRSFRFDRDLNRFIHVLTKAIGTLRLLSGVGIYIEKVRFLRTVRNFR